MVTTLPITTLLQSNLLEGIKQNPEEAHSLCRDFNSLNERGISAYSTQSIAQLASARKISITDAEILVTYVIGLNCPSIT